ncbi:hypothetical protein [Flagellimonas meridianipacifica]|nr:hypothetical protein [Allomuricauda pacifica]
MRKVCFFILLLALAISCQSKNTTKEKSNSTVSNDTVPNHTLNEENVIFEEIEEEIVEDDMDFMPPIEEQSYYGIEIGKPIKDYELHSGTLKTGEGEFQVHYMFYKKDTLGYVSGEDLIETIHIWDRRGATNEGVRVGTTFGEIKDLFPLPKVHGSEMESRVHVFHKKHMYRLDYYNLEYELDHSRIPDSVRVTEIIIH